MIVVDTSALVAILFREPEAEEFAALIQANRDAIVPMSAVLEFRMVALGQLGPVGDAEALVLLSRAPLRTLALERDHIDWAVHAFDRYGKGRHPAGLNFGDCMIYGVARSIGCPLLFKGNDFRRTDIRPVASAFR